MAPGSEPVTRREYLGCGLWVFAFLVLVTISFTVGIILRPDRDPAAGPDAVTLVQRGEAGDRAFRLVGFLDETDEPCVSLLLPDVEGEVAGQCGSLISTEDGGQRYAVTSAELPDGTTVVFAPVPRQAVRVRLDLADGTSPTAEVRTSQTAGFTWFFYETPEDVAGPAEMLDGNGDPISPG